MAMDQFLAEYFGNTKTASANEQTDAPDAESEKTAQMELFCKLAAQNNIDLDSLSEDQISTLWNATFAKEASDEDGEKEKDSEGEDDKKEEAKKEHEEKKEAMAKMAEATFLGKVMAHSLVAELREISKEAEAADAGETQETEENKEAAGMPPQLAAALSKGKNTAKMVAGKAGKAAETVGKKITENAPNKAKDVLRKHVGSKETHRAVNKAVGGAAIGAGAAAAGAAGAAAAKKLKKESSAIDDLAIKQAFALVTEAGFDAEQADSLLSSVYNLGLGESEKVASADDADAAVAVRALEFAEAAGYPVTWES